MAVSPPSNLTTTYHNIPQTEEVNLNQSMLQRILGSGDIRVTGTGSGEVVMKNIDDPLGVQKKINEVRQYQ